jgi:hypothetical protein
MAVIKQLTNSEYHADMSAVSASMLKKLAESPRVYEAEYITREAAEEPTPAMMFGTALHTAVLEPEAFEREYVVCPKECSDRRTKLYKEWEAAYGQDGRIVLKQEEFDTIQRCRLSIARNSLANRLLSTPGLTEKSIYWTDGITGIPCKFRCDKIAGPFVVDIKTTSECTERDFRKTIENYRYHLQAAHYLNGAAVELGEQIKEFFFVVVETKSPFRCRVFDLTPASLEFAAANRIALLSDLARRNDSRDWSEPDEGELVSISLPDWMMKN